MLSNQVVQQVYQGDGTTDTFSITPDIIVNDSSEIKVYIRDESDPDNITETLQVEGAMQDYILTGANPPSQPFDDTIEFNTPPTADQIVIIIRELPLTQVLDLNPSQAFPALSAENTLDRIVAMIQQVNNKFKRVLRLNSIYNPDITDGVGVPDPVPTYLLRWNQAGDALENVDPQEVAAGGANGGNLIIGLPTDGAYGDPVLGDPTGLLETDNVADAFDKVTSLLALIAPTPPEELSAKTLQIIGQYTALAATTGDSHTCTDDTTPVILPNGDATSVIGNSFRDAKSGTLSAEMDNVQIGQISLTAGDDTGVNGELEIVDDFDPYLAVTGEGIYMALIARINSAALSIGQHIAEMIHSLTGTTSLTFYVDDPTTPSITGVSLTAPGSSSYKSGVPGVAQGQNINVQFDVDDFCGTHYNATRIAAALSSQTGAQVDAPLGGPYTPASTFNANINLAVASGAYSENVSVTRRAYNSKGDIVSSAVTNNIRVDTVGTETRVLSSTGQYPASGYGGAFNSTTDVLTGNKELQFINGRFQYPDLVDYTGKLPAGPDYSGLTPDSHNSMRWVTFSLGSVSAVTSVTFTFNSTQNFGATTLISGLECYVRVDGAIPTSGWVDANAAYPGVGNPTNDGDAALDVGSSTVTSRRVTFGAAVRTGTCYVRVGIPSGSTKRFSGVS